MNVIILNLSGNNSSPNPSGSSQVSFSISLYIYILFEFEQLLSQFDLISFFIFGYIVQWVKCDKCNIWQHQICALFNNLRNESDHVDYTCAHCYLSEIRSTEQKILAHSEILEAKHLPRTKLSDCIEQWLSWRLEEDKQKRADKLGKNINEVKQSA